MFLYNIIYSHSAWRIRRNISRRDDIIRPEAMAQLQTTFSFWRTTPNLFISTLWPSLYGLLTFKVHITSVGILNVCNLWILLRKIVIYLVGRKCRLHGLFRCYS